MREILGRRGVVPLIGGLTAVFVIGVLLVVVASGSGGSNGGANTPPSDGQLAGLKTSVPTTPEATLALDQPTVVATRDPNAAVPGTTSGDRLVIGKFGVSAPLTYKVVGPDGSMPNPNGPDDVAFYDFPNHPGLGGVPGSSGNVVLAGHVDSGRVACKNGTVPPPCTAVFWDIGGLKVGDEIELNVSGSSYKYRVTANQSVDAASADFTKIVSSTAQQTITLITCGGDFNPVTHEYNHRQVVTGVRL